MLAESGVPENEYGFQADNNPFLIDKIDSALYGNCCRTGSVIRKFLNGIPLGKLVTYISLNGWYSPTMVSRGAGTFFLKTGEKKIPISRSQTKII